MVGRTNTLDTTLLTVALAASKVQVQKASEGGSCPAALYAALLADYMLDWNSAGPGSTLALRQPPHRFLNLLWTVAFQPYHIAVHALLLLLVQLLLPLLFLFLFLSLPVRLLLGLLLPVDNPLQVCRIIGQQGCMHAGHKNKSRHMRQHHPGGCTSKQPMPRVL